MKLPWRPASAPDRPSPSATVDPESGEFIEPFDGIPAGLGLPATEVRGERTIPSVNRERSMRSRVTTVLIAGTLLILTGAFLIWYYSVQVARADESRAATRKAEQARAAGETTVPPLGTVEPPRLPATAVSASSAAGPAGPSAAAGGLSAAGPLPNYGAQNGPPQKSPEQVALERRLGQPVLLKNQGITSTVGASAGSVPPHIASLLGALPGSGLPTDVNATGPLGTMLRPTPTPAVAAQVLPTRRFLLAKGAFIDCTLETAIDSTFDGMVTCIGASDIYGADGKVVLLERGTKYVGEKRGELRQGQGRVFVLWNEARTPSGVSVNLASPGTDELGRAGLPGFIDTHFWDRFGAAILISVVDGLVQAVASSQQDNERSLVINPQGGRDVMTEVLRRTATIPPTVVKNQGDRIQVLVARDVDFRPVYALRTSSDGR